MQHDCPLSKCTASGRRPLLQERVESGLFSSYIQHQPTDRYVVNTHAFHNAHRLRAALDRSLVAPIPLYSPELRKAKHIEMAQSLRAAQKLKADARAVRKNKQAEIADSTASVLPKKRMRLNVEHEADDEEQFATGPSTIA